MAASTRSVAGVPLVLKMLVREPGKPDYQEMLQPFPAVNLIEDRDGSRLWEIHGVSFLDGMFMRFPLDWVVPGSVSVLGHEEMAAVLAPLGSEASAGKPPAGASSGPAEPAPAPDAPASAPSGGEPTPPA